MVIFPHAAGADPRRAVNPHFPIPNSLISGHHFSASALTSAELLGPLLVVQISAPNSPIRARTFGSASASTAAALSLPTISSGVPLGAKAQSLE